MPDSLVAAAKWLLGPEIPADGRSGHVWARWIFLRALGLVYFSAFYSLLFQIKGLLGPNGLLPAADYLQAVASAFHSTRLWFAPSLFWFGSSDRALMLVCWTGAIVSLLAFFNIWPRLTFVASFVCFLSFTAVAQDFASYQSDGMLLEAGFVALFFAPPGLLPGLGRSHTASRASLYLLRWEWFRIYFESGVSKMTAGDPAWHNFTAMDQYYQNGPLPTWIGWYVQHLPHWFHAGTTFLTLFVELALVWMVFLPRRFRIVCFCVITPFEMGIILTGNYAFLNYIVLSLGFLLLDDRVVEWVVPRRWREFIDRGFRSGTASLASGLQPMKPASGAGPPSTWRRMLAPSALTVAGVCFAFVFYVTTAKLLEELFPTISLPQGAVSLLEPFRIAQDYHLFGTMTPNRMEIEFQGTFDGKTWTPYKFRYKPQDLDRAPGIYAPYQPRFEWNLWFASLGGWREYRFVLWTQERLLKNEPDVLALFAGNPFPGGPPLRVRSVLYQYWFTDMQTKRATGLWWRRQLLGDYAPQLEREPDGPVQMLEIPSNFDTPSSTPAP
jgi:hypothetical protein